MTEDIVLEPLSDGQRRDFVWPTAAEHAARETRSGRWSSAENAHATTDLIAGKHADRLRTDAAHQLLYSIRRDGRAVGTLWLAARPDSELEVVDIFVDAADRRQGVARAALAHLDTVAAHVGATGVRALVFASDTIGLSLFRGVGFATTTHYVETDPRLAKPRRLPLGRLRLMTAKERESYVARHGSAEGEGHGAYLALTGSPGTVLARLAPSPEGPVMVAMRLEAQQRTALGAARLITALVHVCRDRGDARLMVAARPQLMDQLDGMGGVPWRVGSVLVRRSLA